MAGDIPQQHVAIYENGKLEACGTLRPNSNRFASIKGIESSGGNDPLCAKGTPDTLSGPPPRHAEETRMVYESPAGRGMIDERKIRTGPTWGTPYTSSP
jgi:hypothetical protein